MADSTITRKCSRCGDVKPLEEFCKSKDRPSGYGSHCKRCVSERTALYNRQHRKKTNANDRRWRATNPEKRREIAKRRKEKAMQIAASTTPPVDKTCSKCKEVKPFSQFRTNRSSPDGKSWDCYACSNANDRRWVAANPERRKATHERHKEKMMQVAANSAPPAEKTCTKCREARAFTAFRPTKKSPDGRAWECNVCFNARKQAWRKTRPEKEREQSRADYRANPEKHRAVAKKFYHAHKEQAAAQNKAWMVANKERAKATNKIWQQAHPQVLRENVRRRMEKLHGLTGSHTHEEWIALCEKFDNRCVRCGKYSKLTCDHIIPITWKDSTDDLCNLQPLCRECNTAKSNRDSTDYRGTPFTGTGVKFGAA